MNWAQTAVFVSVVSMITGILIGATIWGPLAPQTAPSTETYPITDTTSSFVFLKNPDQQAPGQSPKVWTMTLNCIISPNGPCGSWTASTAAYELNWTVSSTGVYNYTINATGWSASPAAGKLGGGAAAIITITFTNLTAAAQAQNNTDMLIDSITGGFVVGVIAWISQVVISRRNKRRYRIDGDPISTVVGSDGQILHYVGELHYTGQFGYVNTDIAEVHDGLYYDNAPEETVEFDVPLPWDHGVF